ncbi:MAG: VWA domain-containing protein [Thermodesulfobacteriota bacterium]
MLTISYIWVFALLPLPLLIWKLTRPHQEERQGIRVPFFDELAELSGQQPGSGAVVHRRSWPQQVIATLCWLLLIFALARPQWLEQPIIKEVASRDLLLAIDLSGSMQTEDFTSRDGSRVNRLTAAKEVLEDFLSQRGGDRVGLVLFGSAPFTQVPFTEDLELCRTLLLEAQVGMAGPKTALGDTIGTAISLFKESTVEDKLLIVLTDGNDTASKVEPVKAAEIAATNNITIHTVAVGDPAAAGEEKLDEKTLRSIASITGGSYFWAGDRDQLSEIYKKIDAISTHDTETISHRPQHDLYHWPLAIAIILSLLNHGVRVISRLNRKQLSAG